MLRKLIFLIVITIIVSCGKKNIVDCRELATTVTTKALSLIDTGHYTGMCLYAGMADLADERLNDIINDLVSGKISAKGGSLISYQVGGSAGAWLACNGRDDIKEAVAKNAADMWVNQYRTTDGFMTGNIQKDRFRDTIWIDLAFAITPFYLYAGISEGNAEYVEYAADFTLRIYKILYDIQTGLVFQARSFGQLADGEISKDNWSRGQGWLSMALVALLRDYPRDGQRRTEIENVAKDFYTAVLKYQDEDGMWHQEVSDHSTFVETSGSALLLAGIGQAIQSGILPEENLRDFKRGLIGLLAYVDPDGSVGHTCQGTLAPGKAGKEDYAVRHWYFNEPHAFGPVVQALAQAVRLGINEIELPDQLGYKNKEDRPRTYVRYAENRKGDIAWENDFAAYRVYSSQIDSSKHALSGVDMWTKSVDYSIIDKWYRLNAEGQAYHVDRGEGCDFYAVGAARGIGGTGVWAADSLWTSKVYSDYKILRNDPSRISFTMTYDPYEVGDITVTEKKQIDMVLGTPFFKITSIVETSDSSPVVYAVGVSEFGNGTVSKNVSEGKFYVSERFSAPHVHLGGQLTLASETEIFGAAFAQPSAVADIVHAGKDVLLLVNVPSGESVTVYAGALWDQQLAFGHKRINAAYVASLVADTSWESLNELYK